MTTSTQILECIESAAEQASRYSDKDDRCSAFIAILTGGLRCHGAEAMLVADKIFPLCLYDLTPTPQEGT